MMMDVGQQETDKILEKIEKQISMEYARAEKEVAAKLSDYLKKFEVKDALKQKALANGLITEEEYKQWRIGQMMVGKRWAEMRDSLAQDFTNADKIAKSIAFGYQPDVYAINHNYGTFEVEKGSRLDTSYTLYNRHTVEELMKNEDEFIPAPGRKITREINEGKTLAWNKKAVQSAMMQGILQGESIPKMATRLANTVGESDRKAAIRNARTMTTGVENAGRTAAYDRANKLGIETQKMWSATFDRATRHWHAALDRVAVDNDKPFVNEFGEIMYPGDPKAHPSNIFNCRCALSASIKGFPRENPNAGLTYKDDLGTITYDEWKAGHYDQKSNRITKQEEIADAMKWKNINEYKKYRNLENDEITEPEGLKERIKNIFSKIKNDGNMDLENIWQGKPMSIESALSGTNPNFAKGGGYDENCQKCVQAYEYRRRGFQVEALAFGDGSKDIVWGNECFVDRYGKTPKYKFKQTKQDVLNMLDNAPANSRHIIYLKWSEEGGAHVFIAEKENGILKFVDPQSGENGVGRYLDEAIEGKFGYLRVDDKALSQDVDILKSVMKKGTK